MKGSAGAEGAVTGMTQVTGWVMRMRKASYWASGPMLEMSGRSGKKRSRPASVKR